MSALDNYKTSLWKELPSLLSFDSSRKITNYWFAVDRFCYGLASSDPAGSFGDSYWWEVDPKIVACVGKVYPGAWPLGLGSWSLISINSAGLLYAPKVEYINGVSYYLNSEWSGVIRLRKSDLITSFYYNTFYNLSFLYASSSRLLLRPFIF